jgi:tetratricopeptide (TPR) repeat protein
MAVNQEPNVGKNRASMKICPFCTELISPGAKKCLHCGEFVDEKARRQRKRARVVGMLGIITASLSLFYPLREGFFYLQQKQQQRTELRSYIQVAAHFETLDSLKYARQALTKALFLAPNDMDLQRRLLLLQAQDMLREIDWNGHIQQQQQPVIEEMILNGYRLLQSELAAAPRAQLLTIVARLLPQDKYWNDDDGVTAMYVQAHALMKDNAEIAFRYGQWLSDGEIDVHKGIELIKQALELDPNDALYPYELARALQRKGEFGQALPLLRTAIKLLPKQHELDRIRASNLSKSELRKLLLTADKKQDISQGDFYGLTMPQRQELIEQVLEERQSDRNINLIAARFYFANQQYKLAEEAIGKSVSEGDIDLIVRGYYLEQFGLYRDILAHSAANPEKLLQIQEAFSKYQEALGFEEALETGVEGEHRYKIGLRVKKQVDGETQQGLLVLKAYRGYPFAKAGVKIGDRLLTLAHRQPRSVMGVYRILSNFEVGTSLPLSIERKGKELELELLLE